MGYRVTPAWRGQYLPWGKGPTNYAPLPRPFTMKPPKGLGNILGAAQPVHVDPATGSIINTLGLGQTMGPTDIGPVDPETGVPLYSTVDSLQQALANLPFNQLTSVLDPFLASGNIYTGTTAAVSMTPLAIIGGSVLLFVILLGSASGASGGPGKPESRPHRTKKRRQS